MILDCVKLTELHHTAVFDLQVSQKGGRRGGREKTIAPEDSDQYCDLELLSGDTGNGVSSSS